MIFLSEPNNCGKENFEREFLRNPFPRLVSSVLCHQLVCGPGHKRRLLHQSSTFDIALPLHLRAEVPR